MHIKVHGLFGLLDRDGEFLGYCSPAAADRLMESGAAKPQGRLRRSGVLIWQGPPRMPAAQIPGEAAEYLAFDFPGIYWSFATRSGTADTPPGVWTQRVIAAQPMKHRKAA